MALKYPSFLDGSLKSYSNETQRDCDRVGLTTKTCGATVLDEPVLPSLAEPLHRRIQPEQFESDDYQIALVARNDSTDRTGSFLRPSGTADRFLILPFTWRELLDRVRIETNHSNSVRESLI